MPFGKERLPDFENRNVEYNTTKMTGILNKYVLNKVLNTMI